MQKPLFQQGHRYRVQLYIDNSKDSEINLLGYTYLTQFSFGEDMLDSCCYGMQDYDYPKKYKTIGKPPYTIKLHKHTKIEEIVNVMEMIINNEELSLRSKLMYLNQFYEPISYYAYYHYRVGSNTCACHPIKYCNAIDSKIPKLRIDEGHFGITMDGKTANFYSDYNRNTRITVQEFWSKYTLSTFGATKEDYKEFLDSLPKWKRDYFLNLNIRE